MTGRVPRDGGAGRARMPGDMGSDMVSAGRIAALRLIAMAALVASAILITDGLHPDRAFCPMEQACEAARSSALGTFFGIPTALLGAAAFGGLFFLTLLPVAWSRRPLQVAGFLAALGGAGFILYQALVLQTFCPLCLVADVAGLLAGLSTLRWPAPPVRISGRRSEGESTPSRVAWTLAGVIAVAAPFAWPRTEQASWTEIPEHAMLQFEEEEEEEEDALQLQLALQAAPVPMVEPVARRRPPPPLAPETTALPDAARTAHPAQPVRPMPPPQDRPPAPSKALVSITRWRTDSQLAAERAAREAREAPRHERVPRRDVRPAAATQPVADHDAPPDRESASRPEAARREPPAAAPELVAASRNSAPQPPPSIEAHHRAATPGDTRTPSPQKPRRRKRGPVIVEYLNAYCGHCRATHRRLQRVLDEMGVEVQHHRVYAWADKGYPLWVRACAFAATQGAEERMFEELMRAPDQGSAAVQAAARRAELDLDGLRQALRAPQVPASLVRNQRRMKTAGLRGLPTLDIGRRRLMGEQSEAELREALRVALAQAATR